MKAKNEVMRFRDFMMKKFIWLTLWASGYCGAAHAGLPSISGPGGADSSDSSDIFQLLTQIVKWGLTFIAWLLIGLLMLTVIKNAWNKYHLIGEEGSRVTFRDLIGNLIAGAGLLALAVALGTATISIFGQGTINS